MNLPKFTPSQALDYLASGYDTIMADGFEYGFDRFNRGVYAEDLESGDYYVCTGTITNETGWLD